MQYFNNLKEKIVEHVNKSRNRSTFKPIDQTLINYIDANDFEGFVEFVKTEKIDINMIFYTGRTFLQQCITFEKVSKLQFVDYYLEKCTDDINRVDKHGKSAIWEAAYTGNIPIIERLLKRGADYKHENKNMFNFTGVHAAMFRKKYEALFVMIENGVDIEWIKESSEEIRLKHPKMQCNFVDDQVLKIFHYFEVINPRINDYFYILNKQIDYVDANKNANKENHGTLLGKLPKYALKDIVKKQILIKRLSICDEKNDE